MLRLIISLSIPSILAQVTTVLMFFIDASMVGQLGTLPAASIGLVESTTWLFGSITSAASMGFSVQVAHFIGANDFKRARSVLRHGLLCTLMLSLVLTSFWFRHQPSSSILVRRRKRYCARRNRILPRRHACIAVDAARQSLWRHAEMLWRYAHTKHH